MRNKIFIISISFITLCSALLLPMSAWTSSVDDVLPPPESAELLDETDAQVQTYSYDRQDGATVEEYSLHGRVYMLRVQPAGGAPAYYLYDRDGDGSFEKRLPGGIKRLSPPTWVIKTF